MKKLILVSLCIVCGCNAYNKAIDEEIDITEYNFVNMCIDNEEYAAAARIYINNDGKITKSEYAKLDIIYFNHKKQNLKNRLK